MLSLKYLILFVAISLATSDYEYTIKHFEVPLDHFTFLNDKTFKIRYLTNDAYAYNSRSSPIFFFLGNEGNIEFFAKNTGFVWEAAEAMNASIVYAEHRYYGESLPFGNQSFDTPEFAGYLSTEQALADYAALLSTKINTELRPVIVFGGSYGGLLSAWFRIKYPHLTTGAIAASAPMLQSTTDCQRFRQLATSVFTAVHESCSRNIKKSWQVIKEMSATSEGRDSLNGKFQFCERLTKPEDQDKFIDYLVDIYADMAQANYPYEAKISVPLPGNPVNAFCSYLNETYDGKELIDALHQAVSLYSNYTGEIDCIDFSSAAGPATNRFVGPFSIEMCTEISIPVCSRSDDPFTMFPTTEWNPIENSNHCNDKFKVRPNTQLIPTNYGENRLKYASNIVFSNGLKDPWRGGGIFQSPNNEIEIIIIEDAAHQLDLRGSDPNDPESVRIARKMELKTIKKWLSNIGTDYY